jgi:trimeric autotransporter adhesin
MLDRMGAIRATMANGCDIDGETPFARRALALLGVAGLLCVALLVDRIGLTPGASATRAMTAAPSAAMLAASRGIGAEQRSYWPLRSGGALRESVTAGGLRASFTRRGATVSRSGAGAASFALTSVKRGSLSVQLKAVSPTARRNTVSFARGDGITEWYANGPLGLEQGATLRVRSLGGSGTVALGYTLSGSLRPELRAGEIQFVSAHGGPVVSWLGLEVTDARGRAVPAQAVLRGDRLTIRIDDRGALYPLKVDPLMKGATLTGAGAVASDQFGTAVAESGSLLAVGARGTNSFAGAVYVFVKPATGWANANQTAVLTASGGGNEAELGDAVAVSGTTVFASAPNANSGVGAVYAFNEPKTGWANETQSGTLTGSAGQATGFGVSLAASANAVAVGAPYANDDAGQVSVFDEPSTGWTSEGPSATLNPPGSLTFGDSIAISGSTLAVGAPSTTVGANDSQGAVYEYTAGTGGWTSGTTPVRLVAPAGSADDDLGISVAAAGNGEDIAAGAPYSSDGTSSSDVGEELVFSEPGTAWSASAAAAALTPTGEVAGTFLGMSVALSDDGTIAYADTSEGSDGIYRFPEPTSGWSGESESPALTGADASSFGLSVGDGGDVFETGNSANQIVVYNDPTKPLSTAPPSISGQAVVGQTLTEAHGSWTPAPTGYIYQWEDCNAAAAGCVPISGAKAQTYKLAATDAGHTIRVAEAASDSAGTGTPVISAQTAVVQSPSATVKIGHATVSGTTAKIPVTCKGAAGTTCTVKLALSVTETISGGKVTAVAAKAKPKPKRKSKSSKKVVGVGSTTVKLAGGKSKTVKLALNGSGKSLLSKFKKLVAKLTPTSGTQSLKTQNLTFKPGKGKPKPKKPAKPKKPKKV